MSGPRHLISFDWAIKRLLRSKAHFGIIVLAIDSSRVLMETGA